MVDGQYVHAGGCAEEGLHDRAPVRTDEDRQMVPGEDEEHHRVLRNAGIAERRGGVDERCAAQSQADGLLR